MLANLLLGAATGAALGLTGAGGGILAIPLLTFGAGLTHAQAAPIALLAIAMAAALGAFVGLREGVVRYKAALVIGAAGMLVAPLGVRLAALTPPTLLTLSLAVVMANAALTMYRRSLLSVGAAAAVGTSGMPCFCSPQTGRFVWTRLCAVVMAGIGAVTGLLSGLLGVGGGFLLVPAFTRLSNLKMVSIVSTSQAVIALVSAAGAVAAMQQRELDWTVAWPFTAAAMASLLLARTAARRLPQRLVQRSFAALSGSIAVVLVCQVARSA